MIEITSRKLEASLDDIIVMSRLAEAYARFGSGRSHATLKRVLELEPNDGLAVYNCSCRADENSSGTAAQTAVSSLIMTG